MELLKGFSPDGAGVSNGNFFGLPFDVEQAALVLMQVPWDATVSYGAGTHCAPAAIMAASVQGEIYDSQYVDAWREGIGTLAELEYAVENNERVREIACRVIDHIESGGELLSLDEAQALTEQVNAGCRGLNEAVHAEASQWIARGKIVGLVGGEHSVPLGLIRALADSGVEFGVLHIDAHADLRDCYEGFENSHASIMRNVMKDERVLSLTQVAIRDFCYDEVHYAQGEGRIKQFTSQGIRASQFEGRGWGEICGDIVDSLPSKVYISFDIDGLTPEHCPNTGTPVPGGITFDEAIYLIKRVVDSGREILAFDLNEVSPSGVEGDEWDANVGARVLYKLCGAALTSRRG